MIVVNFKTYEEATGEKARELAEDCKEAARNTGKKVVAAPASYDLPRLEGLGVETFAQHLDPEKPGSHTGHILPEGVKQAGASGTLLNHSERRLEKKRVEKAVRRARELGMATVVCAQDPGECGELSQLGADYIAYEPPELIGGDTPVSEARPELIEKAVGSSQLPVLTGAGINSRQDVEKSLELGCEGVLVASSVVKAENPGEKIEELCKGL